MALAYRLVHLLTPKPLTKRLPRALQRPLVFPGITIPPGLDFPPGVIATPAAEIPPDWSPGDPPPPGIHIPWGVFFPPGWTPGDPLPPGITIDPLAFFGDGWRPGDPLPPGVILAPGASFPIGWRPGDPLPPGITINPSIAIPDGWSPPSPRPQCCFTPPALPSGVDLTGPTPPMYVFPWEPGTIHSPGIISIVAGLYTIGADSTDGIVAKSGYGWDTIHDAESGHFSNASAPYSREATKVYNFTDNGYTITRSFFIFDLTAVPIKMPKSVTLQLTEYVQHDTGVSVHKGTQQGRPYNYDYDSFEPQIFGNATWQDGVNLIAFNLYGIAYIASVLGSQAKLCIREYDHDYLDIAPTGYKNYRNGCHYSETTNPDHRPKLLIQM
jgi:hypothetical protein